MEMSQLSKQLMELDKGEHRIIYTSNKRVKVTVTQTAKFSTHDYYLMSF